MAKNNHQDNQMSWIDPDGKLTLDQWLACHLLFYTLILVGKTGPFKDPDRKDISDYTDKAYALLKKAISGANESQLSKSLQQANDSLCDLYININAEHSDESWYFKRVHLMFLKNIVSYIKEHLSDIDFNDYFTDIFFDDQAVYSPMATDILKDYISKMEDEEDENFDDPQMREARETAYLLYKENWRRARPVLSDLSVEKALVSHVLILLFCNRCLKRELYGEYQKRVVDAVSAYKGNSDMKLKKQAVSYADEELAHLMKKTLKCIAEGIDLWDKCDAKNEFFVLASDCAIGFSNTLKPHLVKEMLKDVYVKYDDINANESVTSCAEKIYCHAIAECSEIYAVEDEDEDEDWDQDEEENDKVDELLNIYEESWDDVLCLMDEMTIEQILIAHVIILFICHSRLDKRQFAKYHKAVQKAIFTYKSPSDKKHKESALKVANDALSRLKDKSLEWVERQFDEQEEPSYENDLFSYSLDTAVRFVKQRVDLKTAKSLLNAIDFENNRMNVTKDIEVFSLGVYESALEECERIYQDLTEYDEDEDDDWDEDDEDWDDDDWEDDDDFDDDDFDDDDFDDDDDLDEDDFEDDDEDLEQNTELEERMETLFTELCGLGDEGLLFHAVSLEIMRRKLPENVYEEYRKTVHEFLSCYFKGAKRNTMEGKQLEADNEYINTIFLISDIVDNFEDFDVEGDLMDYMLIPIATENCLYGVSNDRNIDVKKALKEITYNKKTHRYQGEIINKLASEYINLANKELDGMIGE